MIMYCRCCILTDESVSMQKLVNLGLNTAAETEIYMDMASVYAGLGDKIQKNMN